MYDWKKIVFYVCMALYLGIGFFSVGRRQYNVFPDQPTSPTVRMTPEERKAEFEAIQREEPQRLLNDGRGARQYYDFLMRMEKLKKACFAASEEEKGNTRFDARSMVLSLDFYSSDWGEKFRVSRIPETQEWRDLMDAVGKERDATRIPFHQDPRVTMCWVLFYLGSLLFVIVHYGYRIQAMEVDGKRACAFTEAFTNIRFIFAVLAWPLLIGVYPRPINPITQAKLAWARLSSFASLLVSACISFCALAPVAAAQEEDPDHVTRHTLHIDVTTMTWPKYVGGNVGVFLPAPVQQSSVTVSTQKGFSFGAWDSVPLARFTEKPNFGYEVDLFGGWSGTVKGLSVNSGVRYICVTPLGRMRGDAWKYYGGVGHGFALGKNNTISPYFLVERVMPVKGQKPGAGVFLHAGVAYGWKAEHRFSVSSAMEVARDSGVFNFNQTYLALANATVNTRLSKHMTLQLPAISYGNPLTHVNDGRRPEVTVGAGLTYHY